MFGSWVSKISVAKKFFYFVCIRKKSMFDTQKFSSSQVDYVIVFWYSNVFQENWKYIDYFGAAFSANSSNPFAKFISRDNKNFHVRMLGIRNENTFAQWSVNGIEFLACGNAAGGIACERYFLCKHEWRKYSRAYYREFFTNTNSISLALLLRLLILLQNKRRQLEEKDCISNYMQRIILNEQILYWKQIIEFSVTLSCEDP